MKRLVIDVPDWVHKRIKIAASIKGMYISAFILETINQEMDTMSDNIQVLNVQNFKPTKVRFE
jgi:hypothetical protein